MTDRERSNISYFKKQIIANRDNPEAVLELIERMKESNFNYRKNILGLHKNFKDYATFRDSKEKIVNIGLEKVDPEGMDEIKASIIKSNLESDIVTKFLLGKTTKLVKFISKDLKKYEFTICWGKQTSTDDEGGKVIYKSSHI